MGFDYHRRDDGIVLVTMDMEGQSANTMSGVYHQLMGETVARLEAETGLAGVIIASAKKTFFAGGDLHALLANGGADEAYRAWLAEDKGFLRRLERLPVPVVAAINGAALGGGLEICLACHHRVILDDRAAVTGLPEVTLGLLPGAGGCARLPWLTGLAPALDLLLSGRTLAPAQALALGLIDRMVSAPGDLIPAALDWIRAHPGPQPQPWDRAPEPRIEAEMIAARALLAETRARVQAETRGLMPGPMKIVEIVEAGLVLDVDSVLALESRMFCDLLGLPETRAAITLNFFNQNALRSGKLRPAGPRTTITALEITGPEAAPLAALAAHRRIAVGPAPLKAVAAGGEIRLQTAEGSVIRLLPSAPLPGAGVIEIVGDETGLGYDLVRQLGLMPLPVADRPGLFLGRMRAAQRDEVQRLIGEGLEEGRLGRLAHEAGFDLDLPLGEPGAGGDAIERLLFRAALEAMHCLDEGAVRHEAEVNLASVQALGFPRHTGGAAQFRRGLGPEAFTARAEVLAQRHGARFCPAIALTRQENA